MFERILVKKLTIFLGLGQNGQMMGQSFVSGENKRIFVLPGRYAIVEVTTPQGKTVQELNFGQFGWEYVIDDTDVG